MKRLPPGILLLTTATALIAGTLLGSSPGAFIEKGSPPVRSPFHGFLDRLTATGIPDKARQAEGISAEDRIAVIRIAYDLLEDYAASDVSDLRFELSDFELLHPADFEKRLFTDVVTMPGGLMVNVLRSRHTYTNTGEVTLLYITKWTEEEAQPFTDSEGRPLDTMVISEVCDVWVKQGSPEMAAVELITSYRVTVSLRGEQREYQAAFFWNVSASPGDINFLVMDHITQGVAEAVKELEPPIYDPQPEFRDSWLKSLCNQTNTNSPKAPVEKAGVSGHLGDSNTSKHSARATFDVTCSCTGSCMSRCEGLVNPLYCDDSGLTMDGLCHKMTQGQDSSTQDIDSGLTQGASCSAGFACAAKNCIFGCSCGGAGVSVSAGPTSVSFSFSGTPLWTAGFQHSRSCAVCQEIPEEPPEDDETQDTPPGSDCPILIDFGG
ncbi:MAG: hypothetical protein GY842_27735, partial [bacterium]|nr:hypothetical protein [bacterium]